MRLHITSRDLQEALDHGLSESDLRWQIGLLEHPPAPMEVRRPCTINDGILRLDQAYRAKLGRLFESATDRFSKFVPASGAASRMFKTLAANHDADCQRLVRDLSKMPFAETVMAQVSKQAGAHEIVDVLLGPDKLNYGAHPKGLLPYHRYTTGVRTAFEEHVLEAAEIMKQQKTVRIHFTVSHNHQELFEKELARVQGLWTGKHPSRFEVTFSHQSPATDTVALDDSGSLFRERGRVLFRPGGHGALLQNLQDTQGDLVLVKNIDNIVPDHKREPVVVWKQILGGLLLELEAACHAHISTLRKNSSQEQMSEAAEFVDRWFGAESPNPPNRDALLSQLDRPLRVCGVVANQGEPGGGPFWTSTPDGIRPQIVERSQVDAADSRQRELLDQATHFNPVDLAVTLRDVDGRPFDLSQWIDPATVFVSEKSFEGASLTALERPGLWNGAMGRWNTVFVEVPIETFAPVKTVFDLLRPEHQPQP